MYIISRGWSWRRCQRYTMAEMQVFNCKWSRLLTTFRIMLRYTVVHYSKLYINIALFTAAWAWFPAQLSRWLRTGLSMQGCSGLYSLKGLCHVIFHLWFLHQNASPPRGSFDSGPEDISKKVSNLLDILIQISLPVLSPVDLFLRRAHLLLQLHRWDLIL
jgi:hypothetical protein